MTLSFTRCHRCDVTLGCNIVSLGRPYCMIQLNDRL